MDLLKDSVRPLYFRYLAAAFGSALITSVYSIVDMMVVGQAVGPQGTAALAVVAPVWNVLYSLGLLMGIGGSVLFSHARGRNSESANDYFTAALAGTCLLAGAAWLLLWLWEEPVLVFFGADAQLLELAQRYLEPVKLVAPVFALNQMLAAFLRNDGNPVLATAGVLAGGALNVVGDCLFVFGFHMEMFGAGLATALGGCLTLCVLLTHFATRKNTLTLCAPARLAARLREISVTGFSTFFSDAAMGILTVLFNRQIMRYLGPDALAVYGPLINISTFVQCCGYSVGQAAQPILSLNFGAGRGRRVRQTLGCALAATAAFALFWTGLSQLWPQGYIYLFMEPTPAILAIAPGIIRKYSLSFLLLGLNLFATYYFQALMKPAAAMAVSVARGFAVSGALILVLPVLAGPDSMWFAMPVTELAVAAGAVWGMVRFTRRLPLS